MDDSFGSFVDHYILLLAARFHAPLYGARDTAQKTATTEETEHAWRLVATGVQQVLAAPCTTAERAAVRHIEPTSFTPAVCRERARFLWWRRKEQQQGTRPTQHIDPATGEPHSTFDITRDSLAQEVASIYAAVRAALPSTLAASDDSDEDGETINTSTTAAAPPCESIVNVPLASDEDAVSRRAVAVARDGFLSKVQALQADFFATYHRWIDVPASVLETPSAGADKSCLGNNATTTAAAAERAQRAALLHELQESKSDTAARRALDALKTAVHLQRPTRPSRMSDNDIEALYESHTTQSMSKSTPSPAASQPRVDVAPADVAAVRQDSTRGARNGRWQIVEYSEDSEDGEATS